jgi:hypothetical protein
LLLPPLTYLDAVASFAARSLRLLQIKLTGETSELRLD